MWGDIKSVKAKSLIGFDVSGWLIKDMDGRYRETAGRVAEHNAECGRFVVFQATDGSLFARVSGASIHVIKPAATPEPQIREVVKEVVREMTDEEVMRRACEIASAQVSKAHSGTVEGAAWLLSRNIIYKSYMGVDPS